MQVPPLRHGESASPLSQGVLSGEDLWIQMRENDDAINITASSTTTQTSSDTALRRSLTPRRLDSSNSSSAVGSSAPLGFAGCASVTFLKTVFGLHGHTSAERGIEGTVAGALGSIKQHTDSATHRPNESARANVAGLASRSYVHIQVRPMTIR